MSDVLEIVLDALSCKLPARVPSLCLGSNYDFMEQYYAEIGLTYEEFKEFKKYQIPMATAICIKLGIDLSWANAGGSLAWLDSYNEPAAMHGGRFKFVTRMTPYKPPKDHIKRPIPHVWYVGPGLQTKEDIKNHMKQKMEYTIDSMRRLKNLINTCENRYNLVISVGFPGPWENLHLGIGYANAAKFWHKDRKFLHSINNFISDYLVKGMENLVKISKPKVIMCGDDYGVNEGLRMSIEMWRELVKPTLSQLVTIAHDSDVKFILHSCGNIRLLFRDFVEMEIDAVQSLKPTVNDLVLIKQRYGEKIALAGTIDDTHMLKNASPEEVKVSVTQSIKDLGPGGYIPGPTNFLLDQPPQNIIAMIETINNFKIKN